MKQELIDKAQNVIRKEHKNDVDNEVAKLVPEEAKQVMELYRGNLPIEEHEGFGVRIPKGMNMLAASIELLERHVEDESKNSYAYSFKNRYWVDSLYVVKELLVAELGRIKPVPGKHENSNQTTNYDRFGVAVVHEVFQGYFTIPDFEDATFLLVATDTMSVRLETENLKKKYEKKLRVLVEKINAKLLITSLYEGANIKIKTSRNFQGKEMWVFEPFFNKSNPNIILNPAEESVVNDYIIPELDIQSKRSYLFCGGYGNGKTETAMRIGEVATSKGYLFAYVKNSGDFTKVLSISRNYTKLLIFMEDLDELAGGSERGSFINEVLNTLDGIDSKNSNVKVIFTTNHEKKLNPALRRPGRLDLITRFENPERGTACRILSNILVKNEATLTEDIDIEAAIELLASFSANNGTSGAVVAEVGSRALRMNTLHGSLEQAKLLACVNSIKTQVEMMEEDVEEDEHTVIARALGRVGDYIHRNN